MTTDNNEVTHDYESLMNEADQLMEDLQLDEAPPIVIDGFSIDGDEFGLDAILNQNDGAPANTSTSIDDPLAPQSSVIHPLQEEFMTREAPTTSTTTTFAAGPNSNNNAMSPSMMNAASPSLDQIKAQTSKFASSFASFAQKAASQVAAATAAATTNVAPTGSSSYGVPPNATGAVNNNSNTNINNNNNSMSNMMNYSNYSTSLGSPSFLMPTGVGNILNVGGTSLPPPPATGAPSVELDNETKSRLIKEHVGDLLPGERVIMFLSNLLHVSDSTGFSFVANTHQMMMNPNGTNPEMWCCVMTYYRLVLFGTHQPQQQQQQVPLPILPRPDWNATCWPSSNVTHPHLLEIPLASMDRVEKSVYTAGKPAHTTSLVGLVIFGKDNGRVLRFTTPSYADTLRAHEALHTYAFPGRRNLGYLFAFESKRVEVMASIVVEETGQKKITLPPSTRRFEPLVEFQRQLGLSSWDAPEYHTKPWTIYTKLNANYQLCLSYPSMFMGPATLPESSPDAVRMLSQCAGFRSEQRLPALTWANPMDGASIWRSSQPKIGIQGNRSMADEMVLKHIMDAAARANASRPPLPPIDATQLQLLTGSMDLKEWTVSNDAKCALKILDLRPRSAAMANRTSGYGYENTSNYPGATLQFCNIGNIHAVRDSYQKLATLCNNPNASDVQWNALVEDTKWLAQIRTILSAAWEAAFWVHVHRLPVLIHCSHGWDRTSQVSVLTQMMLDPFYRTVRGFTTLVEKDFMSFGHPFHTRCAHGEGRGDRGNVTSTTTSSSSNADAPADEGQISPIFIQFLDCAYQIISQYPECFEFNTNYLLMVSEHVYSCRFGNVLCDTERERELLAGIRQRTYSLWDFLEDPDQRAQVINPNFTSPDGVLLMPLPTLLRNVSLWTERHCKYGAKPTLRRSPPSPAVVAWTTTSTTTPTASAAPTQVAEELSILPTASETSVPPSTEVLS